MSGPFEIVAVIAIVGYVIGRQLIGEPLRGKRVVVLPVVLTIIGIVDLHGEKTHPRTADFVLLIGCGVAVALIGFVQASVMRIEARQGALWGQMPLKGLWLWLLLVAVRVLTTVIADGMNAKVAASGSTILLMLGINRMAQAAVIVIRGMASGTPFAAEDDGRSILSDLMGKQATPPPRQNRDRAQGHDPVDWNVVKRQASGYLDKRRDDR